MQYEMHSSTAVDALRRATPTLRLGDGVAALAARMERTRHDVLVDHGADVDVVMAQLDATDAGVVSDALGALERMYRTVDDVQDRIVVSLASFVRRRSSAGSVTRDDGRPAVDSLVQRALKVLVRLPRHAPSSVQVDLSDSVLASADLRDAHLAGASFARSDLTAADLSDAVLVRSDFSYADLSRAELSGADLSLADLRRGELRGASFSSARLPGVDLGLSDLCEANLNLCDLTGADLGAANMTGALLAGATLVDADLTRANLKRARLTNVDVRGADFSGANLTGATLLGVTYSLRTTWPQGFVITPGMRRDDD